MMLSQSRSGKIVDCIDNDLHNSLESIFFSEIKFKGNSIRSRNKQGVKKIGKLQVNQARK